MKQYSDYDDFTEIIRELAREEIKNILKEEGFCRTMTGQVVAISDGKYSVDLVDTIVNGLLNKTGESIKPGDTVTVTEKYGSNYSNCYISTKNASSDAPTSNELNNRIQELEKKEYQNPNRVEYLGHNGKLYTFKVYKDNVEQAEIEITVDSQKTLLSV